MWRSLVRLGGVHDIRAVAGDEREVKADRLRVADDLDRGDVERELVRAFAGGADAGIEVELRIGMRAVVRVVAVSQPSTVCACAAVAARRRRTTA